MTEWKDIYAELSNKIRWAIGTSSENGGFNIRYSDQKALANNYASDLVDGLRELRRRPDLDLVEWLVGASTPEKILKK